MKVEKLKLREVKKYNSFEAMKSDSKVKRNLSDEEALEKALELLDFFNSIKKAKPLS